ncbi:unnamed protein product, partial [Rotaria socialis]
PTDAYQFFTSGQQKLQKGLLREGFELISEAHKLLNKVYGPMHPEICMCLRLLARLNYIMGNYQEALITQRKAVMMAERVLGIDHPQPATEYIHIALYSFANGLSMNASKLLCRARYIILTCCGENHPQISLIDSNLGLILLSYGDYENALNFYGTRSLKVALSHHLCARIQSYRGDFRSALNSEREAYQIYKLQLGDEHERTRESAQILKHLTEQAVVLQKRINNVVNGQLLVIPSLTIQQPSFQSVLEMLNVVNELAKQSTDDQKLSTPSTTTISEQYFGFEKKILSKSMEDANTESMVCEPDIRGDNQSRIRGNTNSSMRGGTRSIIRGGKKSSIRRDDRPIILESMRLSKGILIPTKFIFYFILFYILPRRDKPDYHDLFVREASIIGDIRDKRFFMSDLCKFDIIRTIRGIEAVNVHIIDRAVNSISKLPKIPKKKQATEQNQVSTDFFRSTITDLFREALKKTK